MHEYDERQLKRVVSDLQRSIDVIEMITEYPVKVFKVEETSLKDRIKRHNNRYLCRNVYIYYSDAICKDCEHRMNRSQPYQCGQSGIWTKYLGWGLAREYMPFDEETGTCSKYEKRTPWYKKLFRKFRGKND